MPEGWLASRAGDSPIDSLGVRPIKRSSCPDPHDCCAISRAPIAADIVVGENEVMASNDDEIYQERILDNYESPYHRQPCLGATHAHEDDNPLCGDVVKIELEIDPERRIRQACFGGDGCCISQAAASLLVREMEGRTVLEAAAFTADEMLRLFGPRLTPNRQKCCLLCWRVLQIALHSPVESGG
jgi:nitrogen fixation protein NifU and related proteins